MITAYGNDCESCCREWMILGWLWRAMDPDGYVLDELVQVRRNQHFLLPMRTTASCPFPALPLPDALPWANTDNRLRYGKTAAQFCRTGFTLNPLLHD